MTFILGFDTETTGFVKNNIPPDSPDQPWPVQIAAKMYDETGVMQHSINFLVNPGVPIPSEAYNVHRITDERVALYGLSPTTAVTMLYAMIARANVIVGHNLDYDVTIIKLAKLRLGIKHSSDLFDGREHFCTQKKSCGIVQIPPTEKMVKAGFHDQYKSPSLAETYRYFFDEELSGAHNAEVDLDASMRIYFHIKKLETMAANV